MKNITVSVDDELYHGARVEAAKRRKSLSALVREFLSSLQESAAATRSAKDPELEKLWALADSKPMKRGSAGPLHREELHARRVSRH